MIRRTFTVLPLADKVHGCSRCHRKLRTGERVTAIRTPTTAEFRHAGRKCPPAYVPPSPYLRSPR